jgi:choline transport protein
MSKLQETQSSRMATILSIRDPGKHLPSSDSEKSTSSRGERESSSLSEINETGHKQELDRNFSLLSICSVGIVTGNTWAALGGSIVVAL